jgi:hypothetical protein
VNMMECNCLMQERFMISTGTIDSFFPELL